MSYKLLNNYAKDAEIGMSLPQIEKGKYLAELHQCSRRFYQLSQYMEPTLFEDLRFYECMGEIKNPHALVSTQILGGPPLAFKMIHTFMLGNKLAEQSEFWDVEDEKALWNHWLG